MEYFVGSIKLMITTFAFAIVISMGVALIIKGIFAGIKLQQGRHSFAAARRSGERVELGGQVGQREKA
mgnify:CR=1 FL=1